MNAFETAIMVVFNYIKGWYSHKRICGGIGYLTPDEYLDSIS